MDAPAANEPAGRATPVLVAVLGDEEMRGRLPEVLGSAYVITERAKSASVVVVVCTEYEQVAAAADRHGSGGLLAVLPSDATPGLIARCLTAGAADVAAGCATMEIAARIRAIARRRVPGLW